MTLLWQRTDGTAADELNSGAESGIDVAIAPDNSGVVVLGNYRDGNIFLAKFSPAGSGDPVGQRDVRRRVGRVPPSHSAVTLRLAEGLADISFDVV